MNWLVDVVDSISENVDQEVVWPQHPYYECESIEAKPSNLAHIVLHLTMDERLFFKLFLKFQRHPSNNF